MGIVDWIYPRICVGCGEEEKYICEKCREKLMKPPAICPMCAKPSLDGVVHARCRKPMGVDKLTVGLPYRGMVQKCLASVKYRSSWDVIDELYEIWREKVGQLGMEVGVVIAVPMYGEKERERGFNQAERLGKLIAATNKREYAGILERVRKTRPMWGLDRKERAENICGAFRTTGKVKEEKVILVDDVWTTGATIKECAKVLKRNGVKEVWAVILSR